MLNIFFFELFWTKLEYLKLSKMKAKIVKMVEKSSEVTEKFTIEC